MGVPAFFRWLSEKYPKTVINMIEQRPHMVDGITVPLDLTQPNPNNMEFDNMYIDMNGIIHPCSHPEDRPMPKTEAEMFVNVMQYVDRIFAAVRPRKVLFLAIDGVAPRAKMNQQRTRRFRSAGEARERHEIKMQTRQEMIELGLSVPPEELEKEWDSNVITPGTEFMVTLAHYLRFYVAHRINTNKAWQNIKVLFSDGSEPGEGEHKIMDFIRKERAQPGYDPNTRHILHGLDADLIMLALATHEPHFTILREQVFFGRRGQDAPRTSEAQRAFDAAQGQPAAEQVQGDHFPYLKPFQMLHVATLREYLRAEFACLEYPGPGQLVAFPYDFERVVDDFVFICFFVGNDFLPHLPSLDIRDGAVDFLLNVYKRVLPALGDYLTSPGGGVNLEKVDVILAEVGRVEDEVFRRRYAGEAKHRARLEQKIRQLERRAGGTVQQLQDKMVPEKVIALGAAAAKAREVAAQLEAERARKEADEAAERARQKAEANKKNLDVAKALRASLRKGTKALKRERSQSSTSLDGADDGASLGSRSATPTTPAGGEEEGDGAAAGAAAGAGAAVVKTEPAGGVQSPKRVKLEAVETTAEGASAMLESTDGRVKLEVSTEVTVTAGQANVEGGEGDEGEDEDEDEVDEEEEEVNEELEKVAHAVVAAVPELEGTELAAAQKELAERVKAKQEAKLEKLRHEIEDTIRYHEAGWKDRYYADKLKKHNVEKGGGKAHMCRTYIEGLCWVFQYYYRGCQAWGWFYPFHYAPFASDLVNIEQYEIAFELGTPLRPLEQLMAVLPPESADALPLPLARLMTAEDSPIKDFYPREVEVDPNGKAMPWLWVTLLPFIDEARLLGTVRAAEAELSPAERKRNELGSSLLCLHEYHPSFRAVADVAGADADADASPAPLALNAASHDGFSGTLSRPPPEAQLALGAPIPAPRNPPYALQDVDDNRALVAGFELPPQSTPHASTLLPGLQYPAARLTDRDKMPRRPPRLGRGLNIADLGMQFGFTELHAHQRMIMHNTPRGGPPMMMAAHASQHHYHQGYGAPPPPYGMGNLAGGMGAMSVGPTGNRSWGSLEPGVNQMKHPGRGYALPPPVMGMPGRPSLPRPALLVPPGGMGAPPPPPPPPPPGYPPQPVGPPPLMSWVGHGAPPSLYPQGGGRPMLHPPGHYGAGGPPPPINIDALKQQIGRAMAQREQEAGSGGGGGGGGGGHRRQGGGGRLQPPHHSGGGYRR